MPAAEDQQPEEDWTEDSWAEDEAWADDDTWGEEDSWSEQDWQAEDVDDRSFLYWELVLSGYYSREGFMGIPMGNMEVEHSGLSPRPPGTYIGLDYVRTFSDSSFVNKKVLPAWLPLTAIDLHPRIVYDRMDVESGIDKLVFAPQDFWARFQPGNKDRLSALVGQFVLPYGVNPPLAPRQTFILPVELIDLGVKWDWGLAVKGPLGDYDWQLATTIGSGMALHATEAFGGSNENSYLVSGRIGAPTYVDLQYGLSFLYGDLPTIRGTTILDGRSLSRWRLGLDGLYKYGTYLMTGAQVTYGQDGFRDDEASVAITMGETADVLGYRVWADWVIPAYQDWRLATQFESVIRDVSTSGTDDTAMVFEARYSLGNATSLMFNYRHEFNRSMGEEANAIYLTYVYYGN